MFKKVKRFMAVTLATALLMGSMSTQVFAATSGEYEVKMSNVEASGVSSYEFKILTDMVFLDSENEIKVNFSYYVEMPTKIDKKHILINGSTPKTVKVSGQTILIKIPETMNGRSDIEIKLSEELNIINPKRAGDYTLSVSGQFKELYTEGGQTKIRKVSKTYRSDSYVIEKEKPITPIPPTNPINPNPIPETPDQGIGKAEVVVRVGSTMGYYSKPKQNGGETVKVQKLTAAPYMSKGNTMIPFRFIAEGLSAILGYDEKTGIVGIYIDNKYMEFVAGSNTAIIDGLPVQMPIAPEIKEGQIMLPLRFAVEEMGAKLTWFNETQTILITK